MKEIILFVVGPFIIITLAFVYFSMDSVEDTPLVIPEVNPESSTTKFSWRFEEAETLNLDGAPQTNIVLTVTQGSKKTEQRVDTVDGSCSEIEGEKHEGDVTDSGRVQCYAAGFGQKYRITQRDYEFFVERKFFEEALPDVEPTEYEWEVIKEYSFL